MSSSSMPALVFDQLGEAQAVLRVANVPVPAPAAGQVRVRVLASVIQPADRLFIAGRYRVQPILPQVAGFDGAGLVDAVGPGVHERLLGRLVAFRSPGAWAQFALAPAERVYEAPAGIGPEQACQFALNPLTAWGLLDAAGVSAGERLLATAGRSAVARWLAALAHARGVQLTLLARAEPGWMAWEPAAGRPLGRASTLAQLLAQAADGRGFDAVVDAVGGPGTLDLIAACANGARLISYGVLDDRAFEITASTLLFRNLQWTGFGIDRYLRDTPAARLQEACRAIWRSMLADPELTRVAASYPLQAHAQALQESRAQAGHGKVLLVPGGA